MAGPKLQNCQAMRLKVFFLKACQCCQMVLGVKCAQKESTRKFSVLIEGILSRCNLQQA